jgi:hypothetical protein
MRFLLVLVGLAALIVAGMMALGLMTLQTKPGSLPSVSFNAGTAPVVKANVATVSVGTENKTVDVPTVTTTQKTITVPTVTMNKPAQPDNGTVTK